MATDVEKLVVQLSADVRSYENTMLRVVGLTRAQFNQIKADASGAGGAATVAFDGASRGVQRFGASAAAVTRQTGALRSQAANLGAQFQDIAVQLQSGANPFTIALQQGTQIAAVLGTTGGGATGAVRALGGAFASLVSPVSLVTIGLIAAGGAAVQYFSGVLDGGAKSEQELQRQSDLIRKVAKDWGDMIPALREAAEELDRLKSISDRDQAVDDRMAALGSRFAEQFDRLYEGIRTVLPLFAEAQREFVALAGAVRSGAADAEDFDRVIGLVRDAFDGELSPAARQVIGVLAQMRDEMVSTQAQMTALGAQATETGSRIAQAFQGGGSMAPVNDLIAGTKEWIAEQERLNGLTSDQLDLERTIDRLRRDAKDSGAFVSDDELRRLALARQAAEKARAEAARKSRGGRSTAVSEAERQREAVAKLIEQLEFEQSLIGLTAVEKEKANALRRAGAAATDDERARIAELVEANCAQIEAIKKNEEALANLKGVAKDVLGGMLEDMRDGVTGAKLLENALSRMIERIATSQLDRVIDSIFAGGFGSFGFGRPPAGTNFLAGVYHGGGVAGHPAASRMVSPEMFAGAHRYHGGGIAGLRPGEVAGILKKGEVILPGGTQIAPVTVNVHNAPPGTEVQESTGSGGARQIEIFIKDQVNGLMAQGAFDGTMRRNFGINRRPGGV